jgi:hypothetical protein
LINIYSSHKFFEGVDGITVVDAYFDFNVTDLGMLGAADIAALSEIENAEPLSLPPSGRILSGRFRSPESNQKDEFLLTDISSGMKTLLLLSLINQGKLPKPAFVNITECGENVLPAVFELLDAMGIPCIMQHICFHSVTGYEFMLNGTTAVNSTRELIELLVEEVGADNG